MDTFDCLAEVFRERVEAEPDRTLLLFEGRHLTRAEVFERSCRVANLPGAGDGRRVGLLADAGPDAVAVLLGCALSGASFVGLDPQRKGADLAEDLAKTGVDLLLVEPKYASSLDDLTFEAFVTTERFLVLDREAPAGLVEPSESFEAALAVSRPLDPDLVPEPAETLAITIADEGTRPVRWTNEAVLRAARHTVEAISLGPSDLGWFGAPLSRPSSICYAIAPVLASGGALVVGRQPSASGFLRDAETHGCTWMTYDGQMLGDIAAHDVVLPRLRGMVGADAPREAVAAVADRFGCVVADHPGMDG
ncbi:MAG TPA: AMP-binding protein [Actinomycetota bacterium]|nr:AMP-binding protein [Actinomycetota bacterium]